MVMVMVRPGFNLKSFCAKSTDPDPSLLVTSTCEWPRALPVNHPPMREAGHLVVFGQENFRCF
jgi:hypothetical protein